MTRAEEVLEALRAGRLCTVCNLDEPDDWSIDLCHACAHTQATKRPLENVEQLRCPRCRVAWRTRRFVNRHG